MANILDPRAITPKSSVHPFLSARWRDVIIGIALFSGAVLMRTPFVGQFLYHWDSINFALAIEHFNVAAGQPHIPGYLLYVLLTRFVDLFFNNHQTTLVSISIVSSGLAVVSLYFLGRELFDSRTGAVGALLLATSPLYWFYGEIALPHSLDTLVIILAVWMLYRLATGHTELVMVAALWLGLAGGLRPQTQVFLAPLALYVAWLLPWRHRFLALGTLAAVDFAWFIPLMSLSGGLSTYLDISSQFYLDFNRTTSVFSGGGWWGVVRNVRKLSMYTLYAWSLALLPFAFGAGKLLTAKSTWRMQFLKDKRVWFFALWIVPSVAYYILIHMGQQGLVFVFLPALCLLSAAALFAVIPTRFPAQVVVLALIGVNCVIFLFAPTYPLGANGPKLLTADTLRVHDRYFQTRFDTISEQFAPENTVIISSAWRFPQYYMPDYALIPFGIVSRWELGEGSASLTDEQWISPQDFDLVPGADGVVNAVIFDADLLGFIAAGEELAWVNLPDGDQIAYLRLTPDAQIHLQPSAIGVVTTNVETAQ